MIEEELVELREHQKLCMLLNEAISEKNKIRIFKKVFDALDAFSIGHQTDFEILKEYRKALDELNAFKACLEDAENALASYHLMLAINRYQQAKNLSRHYIH
ncbi:MAG: hypothetical protein QXN55_00800 [Candidatus Nitrosotenuis sp.]